jgi:hypothetical protein
MAATAENKHEAVEDFCFRLIGADYDEEGQFADYVAYGPWSPIFRGTLIEARAEAERFRYVTDRHECGVCIYAKRDGSWQEVTSYLGHPNY